MSSDCLDHRERCGNETLEDRVLPIAVDHCDRHLAGDCEDGCPWCHSESVDLGGEG